MYHGFLQCVCCQQLNVPPTFKSNPDVTSIDLAFIFKRNSQIICNTGQFFFLMSNKYCCSMSIYVFSHYRLCEPVAALYIIHHPHKAGNELNKRWSWNHILLSQRNKNSICQMTKCFPDILDCKGVKACQCLQMFPKRTLTKSSVLQKMKGDRLIKTSLPWYFFKLPCITHHY